MSYPSAGAFLTGFVADVRQSVLFAGKTRWTAARRVIDLVTPSAPLQAEPDLTSRTSELFTGDGYLTLDTLRVAVNDLPRDNAAALLAGICNPTIESLPVDAAKLRRLLGDPDLRPLLEIVLLWAQRTAQLMNLNLGADDMAVVDRLHESGELEDYLAARGRAYQRKYRAEGIEQGIEQGLAAERDLLRRQAARKFDPRTAERLADLLADIASSEGLAGVGDLIIDCATGEELIERLRDGSPG